MGKIFYLMGKSSSGKDTMYRNLRMEFPMLKPVVLYTTRPMRDGEADGVDYFFVDDKKVLEFEKQNRIIEKREYNTVHGIWKYMTVDDGNFDIENNNYIMIGTLESYSKTREYFGAGVMVPLYLTVDDGERLLRAIKRERMQKEPKYAELCRRFLADEIDFSKENLEAVGIRGSFNNTNKNECLKRLVNYIKRNI